MDDGKPNEVVAWINGRGRLAVTAIAVVLLVAVVVEMIVSLF